MKASAVALFVLALLAVGYFYWSDRATESRPDPADAAQSENKHPAAGEPDETRATPPPSKDRSDNPARDPGSKPAGKAGGESEAPPPPATELGQRYGWKDEDARQVEVWYEKVGARQRGYLDELADGGGRAVAVEYNEKMAKHREELIQRVGVERANQALSLMPMYHFELTGGTWIRVNSQGTQIPFKNPKDRNRYKNFVPQH